MHASDDIAERIVPKLTRGETVLARDRPSLVGVLSAVTSGLRSGFERYQEIRRMQAAEYLMRHLDKRLLREVEFPPAAKTAPTMVKTVEESENIRAR